MFGPWLLAGILAGTATSTDAEYRTVDMIVADVDGSIITYSELLAEANLQLLETRSAQVAMRARLSRPLLRAVLQHMVHRELLLGEIRRLQLRPVESTSVDQRLLALRRRFKDEAAWQQFLANAGFRNPTDQDRTVPTTLRERLRAEAQIERFLEVRVRLNVVVTETDVARCYARIRSTFGGARLALVAPGIRDQLIRQREATAIAALIDQLMGRAELRYHPDFAPPRTTGPRAPARAQGSGFVCPES